MHRICLQARNCCPGMNLWADVPSSNRFSTNSRPPTPHSFQKPIQDISVEWTKHRGCQMPTILTPSENFTHFESNMKSRLINPDQSPKCKRLDAMLNLLRICSCFRLIITFIVLVLAWNLENCSRDME